MFPAIRALTAAMVVAVWVLAACAVPSARADDATEAKSIIAAQIDAFRADDGAKAYGLASPSIQAMFPSVEAFMAMVRDGYAPVYRPQQYQFGTQSQSDGRIVQSVDITAADGSIWTAEYTLARQADGSLKIEGCRLVKAPGVGA